MLSRIGSHAVWRSVPSAGLLLCGVLVMTALAQTDEIRAIVCAWSCEAESVEVVDDGGWVWASGCGADELFGEDAVSGASPAAVAVVALAHWVR